MADNCLIGVPVGRVIVLTPLTLSILFILFVNVSKSLNPLDVVNLSLSLMAMVTGKASPNSNLSLIISNALTEP